MDHQFGYEKLKVWKKSMSLAQLIYGITKEFPASERFGLSDQLRRGIVSVASNITEGTSRLSPKERARFIEVAYGSMIEVICQLTLSQQLGFLTAKKYAEARSQGEEITRMLNALGKSQFR